MEAQPASATFRTTLLEGYSIGFTHTASGNISSTNSNGQITVEHFDFGLTGRTQLGESKTLLYGFASARNTLDTSGAVILPDSLNECTLSLGVQFQASSQWRFGAFLRPGFYGDSLGLKSESFNAPLLGTAVYSVSQELSWIFGFSANTVSDNPLFPIAGVRWQYAPDWTLNLGFPRAGIIYRHNDRLSYNASFTVQGGDYYVSEALGSPAPGVGRLANTWLEYREIHLGVGAELAMAPDISLSIDIGFAIDQRFDYYDRGFILKGETPLFIALACKGRF